MWSIIVGFVIRLLVFLFTLNIQNHDIASYGIFGNAFLEGKSIYPALYARHPYFPVIIYLGALAVFISKLNISYIVVVKIILILIDTFNIYLIYLLSHKNSKISMLYALNPIPILVTNYHGQFDALPISFILLSYYFLNIKKQTTALLFASFAIASKTWPLLFFIPLFKRLKNKWKIILLLLFPLASIMLYLFLFPQTKIYDIFYSVLLYRGVYGLFGLGWFISILTKNMHMFKLSTVFLIMFVLFSLSLRQKNVFQELSTQIIIFFIFTTSIGIQWFMWCVPFFILYPKRETNVLMWIITIYYLLSYSQWIIPQNQILQQLSFLSGIGVWLSFIYCLYKRRNTLFNSNDKRV